MHGLHAYLELVENGRPLDEAPQPPALHEPLMKLLAHADAEGELGVEGAWRLDSRVSRTLEQRYDTSPPGGWAGLAGLACGSGILRARREGFEPELQLAELTHWGDDTARRRLLEAFTRLLVPPATAAGLFILMGLHPAWGLRVAHVTHARGRSELVGEASAGAAKAGIEPGWRDASLFPQQTAEHIEEAIFSAIAIIMATLRKLSPAECYPVDALGGLVYQASKFARQYVQEQLDAGVDAGLAPFLGQTDDENDSRNYRTRDFATVDLLDSLLVPAGVARRFDDGTFCVFDAALEGVRVGEWDADAQEVKLTWMLAGEAGCLVA